MSTAAGIAARRARVLTYLRRYVNRHGVSPAHEEIAAVVGVSEGTVRRDLAHLHREGLIVQRPSTHRAITVLKPTNTALAAVVRNPGRNAPRFAQHPGPQVRAPGHRVGSEADVRVFVRRLRTRRELTARRLSQRAGYHPSLVALLESGARQWTAERMFAVLDALGVDVMFVPRDRAQELAA